MSGKELKKWRERLGFTQSELAGRLGLPNPQQGGRVTIARWESGDFPFPPYLPLALETIERRFKERIGKGE